ncbi:MAG: nucleotidyltransferase [Acidobacteriota bacterium]|nr:nucleotidyltransferase [Acidobacteriota bacterium]
MRMAIPPMDENLKQLLSVFNAKHVKYVVIGGYAVFLHAQPRMTKDLDVFIEARPTL